MIFTSPAEAVLSSKAEFKTQFTQRERKEEGSFVTHWSRWDGSGPCTKGIVTHSMPFCLVTSRVQKKPLKYEQCTMFYLQLEELKISFSSP